MQIINFIGDNYVVSLSKGISLMRGGKAPFVKTVALHASTSLHCILLT